MVYCCPMGRTVKVVAGLAVGGGLGLTSGEPAGAFWGAVVVGGIVALATSGADHNGQSDDGEGGAWPQTPTELPRIPRLPGPVDTVERINYALSFLAQAFQAGQLHEISHRALRTELQRRLVDLAAPEPEEPPIPPPPDRSPEAHPPTRPSSRPVERQTPTSLQPIPSAAAEPVPEEPRVSPWAERMRAAREMVVSDFAVHGLAYLGVLLVFAGTLGFVLFSFRELSLELRPLAELTIPAALFGSAWFLRTRGAPFAAQGLTFLGGTLVPIVIAASFRDGASVPPDLEGASFVLTYTAISIALAIAYGAWSLKNPESPLRFLAAPMAWVSVLTLGLGFGGESATGGVTLTAAQMALTGLGVLATLVAARLAGDRSLARASEFAAIPGVVVTYALTLLFAWQEGWPLAPSAFAGIAVVLSAELERDRLGEQIATASQLGSAALTLWAIVAGAGMGPGGVFVIFTGLVLLEWYLSPIRSDPLGAIGAAGMALAGLALVTGHAVVADAPSIALWTWSVVAVWSHVRRRWAEHLEERIGPDVGSSLDLVATIAPVVTAVFLVMRFPSGGIEAVAVAVCAGAILNRWPGGDGFYRWWLPACSWLLLAGTVVYASVSGADRGLVIAAALGALALALGRDRADVRVWTTSLAGVWASWLASETLGTPESVRLSLWALTAFAVVVIACVLRRRAWAGHLEAVGHLGGLVLLLLPSSGWGRIAVLSGWCAGWVAATYAGETGGSPLATLLVERARRRVERAQTWDREGLEHTLRWLPVLLVTTSLPLVVLQAGYRSGLFQDHRAWAGLAMSLLALAYGACTRAWLDGRGISTVLSGSGFVLSLVAVGIAAPNRWPTILATAGVIATVAATAPAHRRAFMTWTAWAATVPLSVLLARQFGVAVADLSFVVLAWGGLLMLGGLAAQRQTAAIADAVTRWAAPSAIGALAFPTGLALTFTRAPIVVMTCCFIGALAYFAASGLLRSGAVSTVSWALIATGVSVILPTGPLERPWEFVPMAAVLLVIAWLLRDAGDDAWSSWSLPPLAVAHALALIALVDSVDVGDVVVTWGGSAMLSFAVWAWRRRWEWAWAGDGLLLVAAGAAGHGWLALALGATTVSAFALALRAREETRLGFSLAAAAALAGGWIELLIWSGWPQGRCTAATALLGGTMAVAVAVGIRWLRADPPLWAPWAFLAAAMITAGCGGALQQQSPRAFAASAAALALATVAVGGCAQPLRADLLRGTAAVLAVLSGGFLASALDLPTRELAVLCAIVGLGVILASLVVQRRSSSSPWVRPVAAVGGVASAVSIFAALQLEDSQLLSFALLLAGLEAAIAAFAITERRLVQTSLALFCLAWCAWAFGWSREIDWYTVPIGVTLLAILEIERTSRKRDHLPLLEELQILEWLGMALTVVAPLLQIVLVSPAYGAVAIALGAAIGAWGGATHVRRRVFSAAVTILAAVVLMLAGPIADIVENFRGTTLWIGLAVVGAILIGIATSLERSRERANHAIKRLNELMEGWE